MAEANGLPEGVIWQDIASSWRVDLDRSLSADELTLIEQCVWSHRASEQDPELYLVLCNTRIPIVHVFEYCPATGRSDCDVAD
ncbi:hypothetical protein [Maricaulis sp.]|uniref:hypothetical protein n=1 Tax=Maricaulis sp. TaxID=1486257 RepID=UPI002B2719F1|nr:hypothetical protein [Maricaulis sp.]